MVNLPLVFFYHILTLGQDRGKDMICLEGGHEVEWNRGQMDAFFSAPIMPLATSGLRPWLSWSRRGQGTENDKERYEAVARRSGLYDIRVGEVRRCRKTSGSHRDGRTWEVPVWQLAQREEPTTKTNNVGQQQIIASHSFSPLLSPCSLSSLLPLRPLLQPRPLFPSPRLGLNTCLSCRIRVHDWPPIPEWVFLGGQVRGKAWGGESSYTTPSARVRERQHLLHGNSRSRLEYSLQTCITHEHKT